MAVFLTGDIHGDISLNKLGSRNFDSRGLTRDDYVIILGDFGLVWGNPPSSAEVYWLDWLESKPWTTLFIDGNHENFDVLDAQPVMDWHGGKVHVVRECVFHLMRGQVFDIGGRSFFTMGGAHSIDMQFRTPHASWWPQEAPNMEEREWAAAKVAEVGSVDYILTHCPPSEELMRLGLEEGFAAHPDEYNVWLQREVAEKLAFSQWFYGHMHIDQPRRFPYTPLFDAIYDLDATGRTPYGPDTGLVDVSNIWEGVADLGARAACGD